MTVLRFKTLALALAGALPVIAQAQQNPDLAAGPEWEVLESYCLGCHNFEDYAGGIALDTLDLAGFHAEMETWEKVVRKLRTGLMPPAGEARPARTVLDGLAAWAESGLDAEAPSNPGTRPLARLNRAEYRNAVRDLLHFDPAAIVESLPEDRSLEGFDNMAQALSVSPTLLEAWLGAAMDISRQAVGDPSIGATDIHYRRAGSGAQTAHLDGQPPGTRGGLSVEHHFPLDAEYLFRVQADIREAGWTNDEGRMWWCDGRRVDIAFNGVKVEVEDYRNFRLRVPAGPQLIQAALVDERRCAGVVELYLGEARASVGGAIEEIEIQGPFEAQGPGDTPSRRRIFICQPREAADEEPCARDILSQLATRAYRRPVAPEDPDIDVLMQLYRLAREAEGGGFELGIQYALSRLLVDPRFLYRFEEPPPGIRDGEVFALGDFELAARLSFFLWSSIPDDALLARAAAGELRDPDALAREARRLLEDPRSRALVDNFAGQWLRLRDLDEANPRDPDFDEELRRAFRLETELLFESVMRGEAGLLALLDADFTFLNERLARHYGIEGVRGSYMRRVELPPGSPRRGLLGHGGILTATSNPNRTSPVVRGVWVVESLLGAEVPQPPPGVETNLEGPAAAGAPQPDTLRARLEQHRADPACAGCHGIMDPVGLALENFDFVGRWRERDNGRPIDAASTLVDGTGIDGPGQLREALLGRSQAFVTALGESLLSYALGRPVEYSDGPAVRAIVKQVEAGGYSFAALVEAIVRSEAFRMQLYREAAAEEAVSLAAAGERQ